MLHRVFVEVRPSDPDRVVLDAREARHLRARRLVPGDSVQAIVAPGIERMAVIERIDARGALLRLGARVPEAGRDATHRRMLALALADPARMDLVVEKATELGVTTLQPFRAARSQIDRVSASRLARWRRIARAASEQCGHTTPPIIAECVDLGSLCRAFPAGDQRVALDPAGTRWRELRPGGARGLVLIIGPEGGFAAAELELLSRHSVDRVSLGPRILRCETAAIAALAIAEALAPEAAMGGGFAVAGPANRS